MASTPLYKSLKTNGSSFYAFPGAAEDISAAYQNANYKMYFSKFALLNFPKQNLTPGTQSNPVVFDFDNSFLKSVNATPTPKFKDAIVESLRNYVANQETVIRETRLNDNQYYYNTNALATPTEKVFFKWCRKLNAIDFEAAIPKDEYFDDLIEFQPLNGTDKSYFPEYLWKERETINWDTVNFYVSSEVGFTDRLEVEFDGETNFRQGDTVRIYNVSNSTIDSATMGGVGTAEGQQYLVLKVMPPSSTEGERVIFDVNASGHLSTTKELELDGQAELVYNRLIQYVGEITGISNVQEANRSYTEVYAQVPDHLGQTPDVLFRTTYDENYKPNLIFPVLASQIQPEIMGAENFTSPIVSSPQNYPGSYLGQFDTIDFTYETSSGDELRRSGSYYGITGDRDSFTVGLDGLDGLGIDFDTNHYVKMNIPGREVSNFEQFNGIQIDNLPPMDFEFNAILWYYTVEDSLGNSKTNLYGVSFLDNPDNNTNAGEAGARFPSYKKLVTADGQDGTSYSFNLNLNFNILSENPSLLFNPQAVNSIYSMEMFNEAMQRLTSLNDSFLNVVSEQSRQGQDIQDIKGLIYTQNDVSAINAKISNLENLLKLYSTAQISTTDSVRVTTIPGNPPRIALTTLDTGYGNISEYRTADMYSISGQTGQTQVAAAVAAQVIVPETKDFLISIVNNDTTPIDLANGQRLTLVLNGDISFKQTAEIIIRANGTATENKRLDIYLNNTVAQGNQILLAGNIDLPILYNSITKAANSASLFENFNFPIDLDKDITLKSGPLLDMSLSANPYLVNNSVKAGDTLALKDFLYGTSSIYDFSGQYEVANTLGGTSSAITLDLSNNPSIVDYAVTNASVLPIRVHSATHSMLSNLPSLALNKGKKIIVTRVSESAQTLAESFRVEIKDL